MPPPVLFNSWKHHAGALRRRIEEAAAAGQSGLTELAGRLIVLGTELMDLYTGGLSPAEIALRTLEALRSQDRLAPDDYRAWLEQSGGYGVLTLDDSSRWVLRMGEAGGRFVHVHPARWAPQTRRVRANVLKTAVMALAAAAVHGSDPLDVAQINRVRQHYLGLSPVRGVTDNQGLHAVLGVLRPPVR